MTNRQQNNKSKLDYTYVIIAVCFVMVLTTLGFVSSTGSLFIGPVCDALGIDRGAHSIYKSFRFVSTAVINIFFASLITKFGAKKLIAAGFFSLIAAMLLFIFTPNVWGLYLGGCLLGIGFSWTTTTMVGYVINKWVTKNRGTVMGTILAANGIGGAIATWVVTPIINKSELGYKNAYFVISCILALVGAAVLIFFKNAPNKDGVADDKSAIPKKKARGESWVGIEYSEVKKKPYFYGALVCIFLTGFVLQSINGVAAQYMRDVGISPTFVATVLIVHSLALFAFKFLTGVLYDKRGLRTTVNICAVTGVGVMLILFFLGNSMLGVVLAVLYGIFSSLALPLETILLPIYASDLFGQKPYNKTLGLFVSVNVAGYALGAPAMGLWYDIFGSYKYGFLIAAVVMIATIVALQFVISAARRTRRDLLATIQNETK